MNKWKGGPHLLYISKRINFNHVQIVIFIAEGGSDEPPKYMLPVTRSNVYAYFNVCL